MKHHFDKRKEFQTCLIVLYLFDVLDQNFMVASTLVYQFDFIIVPIMRSQPTQVNNPAQRSLIEMCNQALSLFLGGHQTKLKAKLQQIHQKKISSSHNPLVKADPQKKGKFEYQLNFQQDSQQNQAGKKQKSRPKPRMRAQRTSEYCLYCPQNEQLHLLSASNFVYLAMPKVKTFRKYYHYILAPVDHIQTRIGADQNIQQQLKNYQKCLIQMFDKMGLHAIFIQQFSANNSHIYIECIGIPLKKAYDLPFFFKQALENVEGFWTSHKNIIEIRKEKGGLQKQIPKQIKYFYIDFGLGYGYAHVIEDQKYWDRKFCYEIVASALGMQSYEVKSTQQYSNDELEIKSKQFQKIWKPFDWTALLDNQQQK